MEQVIAILGENDDGSIKVEVMEETADNLDLYKEEFVNDFRIEMETEDSANGSQTIPLPAIAPDEILKPPHSVRFFPIFLRFLFLRFFYLLSND